MTQAQVVRRLIGVLASPSLEVRRDLSLAAGCELLGIGLTVAAPYSLKILVDVLSSRPAPSGSLGLSLTPQILLFLIVGFVLSWSGASITGSLRLVFSTRLIERLGQRLSENALRSHLPATASTAATDARGFGALERLPYSLQLVIDGFAGRVLPLLLQLAIALVIITLTAPVRYALLMGGVIFAFLVSALVGGSGFQRRASAFNDAVAAGSDLLQDLCRNSARVVFNGALDHELDRVKRLGRQRRRAAEALTVRLSGMSALQYVVLSLGLGALLYCAAFDVQARRLSVGDFVLLQAYAFRLALPLSGLGLIWRQASAALMNVAEVLDMATPVPPVVSNDPQPSGALALRHVSYRYLPDGPGVSDITTILREGQVTALVGPNGSGKSTLARLMAGILRPDAGQVMIGDSDLAAISTAARHRFVLYVPQRVGLFNRSLAANGVYPPSDLSAAALGSTLERWDFVASGSSPNLEALVGIDGARLSGGQVQKLELARLLGVRTPILILDESTSALDAETIALAVRDLRTAHPHQTLVIVTHTLSVVQLADWVLVLRAGRLVAEGPHLDLCVDDPNYAALWRAPARGAGETSLSPTDRS